ncbi:large conductance mechanosensitive channel protein MscL [Pedobacter sp. MR2016-24]|uniref:large conductance mechanosensitive channel protein MscL n=1 Tax=Pedobacter sp. MR2016-24 TaxID=2994466 RepID=UPI002247989F|nr:large conductance mechanosensitive channel protein MscL [Pedobacter sp. MR2016-24]MCX2486467.1 large conductance mechanosensitive channel protein MscL [Pedobacter sp. MR2016-24]
MSFIKEFKEFAMKGNVIDLAVGVIIGGAFGKIVTSMVNDLIMPPISLLIGDKGFANFYIPLNSKVQEFVAANPNASLEDARKAGPVFAWGNFATEVINFIILAFIIFLMVKAINSIKRKQEEAPKAAPAPTKEEVLLGEIRDLLKARSL